MKEYPELLEYMGFLGTPGAKGKFSPPFVPKSAVRTLKKVILWRADGVKKEEIRRRIKAAAATRAKAPGAGATVAKPVEIATPAASGVPQTQTSHRASEGPAVIPERGGPAPPEEPAVARESLSEADAAATINTVNPVEEDAKKPALAEDSAVRTYPALGELPGYVSAAELVAATSDVGRACGSAEEAVSAGVRAAIQNVGIAPEAVSEGLTPDVDIRVEESAGSPGEDEYGVKRRGTPGSAEREELLAAEYARLTAELESFAKELRRSEERRAEDRDKLLTALMRTHQEIQQLKYEISLARSRRDRKQRGLLRWLLGV